MKYVGALDQGTSSTRFLLFDRQGSIVSSAQKEHRQIYPQPGWVEHDPAEIWNTTAEVMKQALALRRIKANEIAAIGITNQRETIIAWEPASGIIRHNAIVWQDMRGSEFINHIKKQTSAGYVQNITGLIPSPYFSASKIVWMLEHEPELRKDAQKGKVVFGTIDTFLVWQLTGGAGKGVVLTDATNASRYMVMDLQTLDWSDELLQLFDIPRASLPTIVSSFGEIYGTTVADGPLGSGIPVCGILGDQQAALFGQGCFEAGEGKSTYGTGCFLLTNIGPQIRYSTKGLLSTVAYKSKHEKPVYALEGSIAVAGSLVQWLRDNLKLVTSAKEVSDLAETVADSGGVYIVPAFSGLFAPYWRSDARGIIAGLTGYVTAAHICRAALEATAYQVKDIFDAMEADSQIKIQMLKVDGGMTASRPLMEFQADLLGIPVIRPSVVETTALGAAYAAGLSVGFWQSLEELKTQWQEKSRGLPVISEEKRQLKMKFWNKAIERTLNWQESDEEG